MKKWCTTFLALGLFANTLAFAYQDSQDDKEMKPSKEAQMVAAYNAPSRIDVKGAWDFCINASFIYWEANQKAMEIAYKQFRNVAGTVYKTSSVRPRPDFDPGFKVGIGMLSDRDNWDILFQYTWLRNKNKVAQNAPLAADSSQIDIMYPSLFDISQAGGFSLSSIDAITQASSRWRLNFNVLDFELGRSYYVGKKLSFRPFVGMKAGWLDQKLTANYIGYDFGESDLYNMYGKKDLDTWLLGPRVGINTCWNLGEGFRLFANAAGSLFYQHFDSKFKVWTPAQYLDDASEFSKNEDRGFVHHCFETALGFGWASYFADDEWHIDISAGYEFQIYMEQNNQINTMTNIIGDIGAESFENLTLQGFTVSFRLDF